MHRSLTPLLMFAMYLLSADVWAFSLPETVRETLKTNPQMQAALNALGAQQAEVAQARARYLPKLQVSAGIGEETRRAPATGDTEVDLTREELSVQAEQLVFDGMASFAEIKRQRERVESQRFELLATAEDLALRTAEVYLQVLRQTALLDLARSTLWEHQNIYDQMKLRSDQGVGSKADLDQIAARLALANANTVVAQNNLADAQASFFRVTGFYPNLNSMETPENSGTLPASLDDAIRLAEQNNPSLISATADSDAAKSQHKAAAGVYWPTFKLEAEKRWDKDIGGVVGQDEDTIIALRMEYNLFNGGADRARRKQTARLFEQAKDIRNNARRQVIEGMSLSWNSFEALQNQMVFLKNHVEAAEATKAAYAKQFNIGRRTLLDLLNTENEVVDAKRALINAEFELIFTRFRIFNAGGTLLPAFGIDFSAMSET